MTMVRPRTGDFLYSQAEFDVMVEDIRVFKEFGADGVVFGILTLDGRIDIERTALLVDEAFPMQVCFHRAFDMTRDPVEALFDISTIPHITRILTSGHGPTAPSGLSVLQTLLTKASGDGAGMPTILAGSGINVSTVRLLLDTLLPCGLSEIHLSAGMWIPSKMKHKPLGMGMGVGEGEWGVWRTSEERVSEVRSVVDVAWNDYLDLHYR
ncbi:hypothetical protein SCP_0501580 [Sparassis crispa]|uniref:Copper homeostasis protein cutC homolog n=1 Tax=Sparassis crispa TaxID=139825 RepID=A0A401GLN8_9APHY|nr:hypothetical protein SCP_0501580 [Sparassis crispa]GBE83111.1 hypothetical protein SCP_0501580 [Sparassis crispa]